MNSSSFCKSVSLILIFSIVASSSFAQTLTISTGGQTGTSGTNWTASGSNPVRIVATGTATIHPSVIQGFLASDNVEVEAPGSIAVNSSITKSSGGDATLTLQTPNISNPGFIDFATGVSIVSTSGKLNLEIKTRTGSSGSQAYVDLANATFTTNGGSFTNTGSTSYSSGTPALNLDGTTITTDGGNVSLFGNFNVPSSTATNYSVYMNNVTVNTVGGSLTVSGLLNATSGTSSRGIYINGGTYTTGATTITGYSNSDNYTYTTQFSPTNFSCTSLLIESRDRSTSDLIRPVLIGSGVTASGNISVYGSTIEVGGDLNSSSGNGNIVLEGTTKVIPIFSNKSLTSGSGNITLTSNDFVNSSRRFEVSTTGMLTIQPYTAWTSTFLAGAFFNFTGTVASGTFTGSSSFPETQWLIINSIASLGGFTLGRSDNSTNSTNGISIDSPIEIAGPISIYGAAIAVNADLTATGGNILLDADYGTALATNSDGVFVAEGVTIQTNTSGDITFLGRSGNNNTGSLIGVEVGTGTTTNTQIISAGSLTITGISTSASGSTTRGIYLNKATYSAVGDIILTGTGSPTNLSDIVMTDATITSTTGSIEVYGGNNTGSFYTYGTNVFTSKVDIDLFFNRYYLSNNTIAFNAENAVSFLTKVDQTTFGVEFNIGPGITFGSNVKSLTIGNTGNNQLVTINTPISIAGPINIYGGSIDVNSNITATGGDILLDADLGSAISGGVLNGILLDDAITISTVTSGDITLIGRSGDAAGVISGIRMTDANVTTISAAGNISMTGRSFATSASGGRGIDMVNDVLTATGSITITGQHDDQSSFGVALGNTTVTAGTGITLRALDELTDDKGTVIPYDGTILNGGSGLVELIGQRVYFGSGSASTLTTTGAISILSEIASFADAVNTSLLTITGTPSSLTIGKSTNTSDITIGTATSISGPITIYGGVVNVDANLTSTALTGNGITIQGQRILQDNGIDATTSGAYISYTATNFVSSTLGEYVIDVTGSGSDRAILNANGGDISIAGSYGGGAAGTVAERAIGFGVADLITSGSGNISIIADATNSGNITGTAWGMQPNDARIITDAGNITLTMTGGAATVNSRGLAVAGSFELLSSSGTITLRDLQPTGLTGTYNGLYLEPSSTNAIVFGADGSTVSTSSSNIIIEADKAAFVTRLTRLNTSGMVTVSPVGTSFATGLNNTYLNVESTASGLMLGKPTSTSIITIDREVNIAGPITIHSGDLTLNQNLVAQSSGNITLFCNTLSFGSGKTLTSSGRLQIAPTTVTRTIGVAGATGDLSLPVAYFTTNFTDGFSSILIGSDNQTGGINLNAISMRDPLSINTSGALTLGGLISLGNSDLTLNNRIASINASTTEYFQTNGTGKVSRNISNGESVQLPVGNSSYNPLTITNYSGVADDFAARVLDAVYDGGTTGTAITDKVVKRTWDISKTLSNGGSGIDMTFEWAAADEVNVSDYQLSHFGTFWAPAVGTSGSPSGTTTKTMTHTGYTGSFSPFAIGSTSSALPVTWMDFSGVLSGNKVQLKWSTAQEQNTRDFVVEHATGNGNWKAVGVVQAAGNSREARHYEFGHTVSERGLHVYRLRQRDLDGKEQLSKLVSLRYNLNVNVWVFPNPANGNQLSIQLSKDTPLQLLNSSGQIVKTLQGRAGVQLLDVSNQSKGLYYLRADKEVIRILLQ